MLQCDAHIDCVMMDAFSHQVAALTADASVDRAIVAALADVCSLFGLGLVEKHLADLLLDGFLTQAQALGVRSEVAANDS